VSTSTDAAIVRAHSYYLEHQNTLTTILDDVIERARSSDQATPAEVFAALIVALDSRREQAVTTAALAIMRILDLTASPAKDVA
jgi:hypothetical protein